MESTQHYSSALPKHGAIKKQVVSIVAIFISVSIAVFGLAYFQSEVMNAVRAYVRGEGLWAKSQKDAVIALQNFTLNQSEDEFKRFQQALEIPLADRNARIALEGDMPDKQKAYDYFIKADNSEADSEKMVWFYLWFNNFPYMRNAVKIWRQADKNVFSLQSLGKSIYAAKRSGEAEKVKELLEQLNQLNQELAIQETDFSNVLSDGAVWVNQTTLLVNFILLVLMLSIVIVHSRRVIISIDREEKALLISEARFKSLYQSDLIGIFEWHFDGRIFAANDAFLKIIGYSNKEFNHDGLNWRDITPPGNESADQKALEAIKEQGFCKPIEKEYISKNGQLISILMGAALLGGEDDKGVAFVVDLTEKRKVEQEVRLLASIFESSNSGALATDLDFKVITVNQNYINISGFDKKTLIGNVLPIIKSNQTDPRLVKKIKTQLQSKGSFQGDITDPTADGKSRPSLLSINGILDANNKITHYAVIITDISKRKAMEEKLRHMAHYDLLTGLANRALLKDRHKQALSRAKRNKSTLAVLFIDLDNFKPINDQHGHEAGDYLLKEVSKRLNEMVRENDSVARLGGDEFVVILEDLEDAKMAGTVACKIIESLNIPVLFNQLNLQIGCSIGISIFPGDGDTVEAMMRFADIAMYAAKASGRNNFYYFDAKDKG
jgi:diguanylate cyclase (GGDEF)-like protein/PAS domain S-box-containing protein